MKEEKTVVPTIRLKEFGSTLGLRQQARDVSARLADGLNILDFEGVECVTSAFADELFGNFIRANGIKALPTRFKGKNAVADVQCVINWTIKNNAAAYRSLDGGNPPHGCAGRGIIKA